MLLDALLTLASTHGRLTDHNVTIRTLRTLLRIEKSSEKKTDISQKSKNIRTRKRANSSEDERFTAVSSRISAANKTTVSRVEDIKVQLQSGGNGNDNTDWFHVITHFRFTLIFTRMILVTL